MRRNTIFTAILFLGLAACGDDANSSKSSSYDDGDAGDRVDDGGFSANNSGIDLPDAEGETDAGMPNLDSGSEPDMPVKEEPEPLSIAWPATYTDFVASATDVSYVSELAVAPLDANGYASCCRDFAEMSRRPGLDNGLAALLAQVKQLAPESDPEGLVQDAISGGELVVLLDHREYEGPNDSDGWVLSWLTGEVAETSSLDDAVNGSGIFMASRSAFVDGTGEPRSVINPVVPTEEGAAGSIDRLIVQIPAGVALVPVALEDVSIEGKVRGGEIGPGWVEGRLSGYVESSAVFESLNGVAESECGCLGLGDQPLYAKSSTGNWSGSCTAMAHVLCDRDDELVCRTLGGGNVIDSGFCSVLPQTLQNAADLDTDGDGSYDALSVGLKWSAVPARLR